MVNDFLQRLETTLRQRQLLAKGQKALVAVSGGVDSMVLLHSLGSLAKLHRWELSVAHFNHQLRGAASDADEALVRKTAAKMGLPMAVGSGDVRGFARQSKISTEMAARKLRHEFLARTAREVDVQTVAVAHHADDQVELFFLRLFRGSGSEGITGMKWTSPSPADQTIAMIRPLLEFSKSDLENFARAQKIRYRKDASNSSNDFLRNRVRNELLPLLCKKYQPGIDRTVLRLMEIAAAESEVVAEMTRNLAAKKSPSVKSAFADLPLAIQRRLLHQRLLALGLMPDFDLIEQLRSKPIAKISVGTGLVVFQDGQGMVRCQEQTPGEFSGERKIIELDGKKTGEFFGGRNFKWQIEKADGLRPLRKKAGKSSQGECEYFDAQKVGNEVVLRHWRPGDRFQPIGLKSAAKLQDLFVNAKIPAKRRRELVVAATRSGDIFWVEGLRIGEQFKLTPRTRRQLVWRFEATAPNYPTG